MPALHAALSEGLSWQQGSDVGAGSRPSIDAWTWLTVAVFACSQSCGAGPGCTLAEEHVVLAKE